MERLSASKQFPTLYNKADEDSRITATRPTISGSDRESSRNIGPERMHASWTCAALWAGCCTRQSDLPPLASLAEVSLKRQTGGAQDSPGLPPTKKIIRRRLFAYGPRKPTAYSDHANCSGTTAAAPAPRLRLGDAALTDPAARSSISHRRSTSRLGALDGRKGDLLISEWYTKQSSPPADRLVLVQHRRWKRCSARFERSGTNRTPGLL